MKIKLFIVLLIYYKQYLKMSCINCGGGCNALVKCPYLGTLCGGGYTEKEKGQIAFAHACVLRAQQDGIAVEEAQMRIIQEAIEAMKKEAMKKEAMGKKAVSDPTIGKRAVEV